MIPAELLDRVDAPPAIVRASLSDIRRANTLFGGRQAVIGALEPFLRRANPGDSLTLVDLGTGAGDIPRAAARLAARFAVRLRTIGVEHHRAAAQMAREAGVAPIVASVDMLPLRARSVDFVVMSQLLHHAPRERAAAWIRAADRVARRAVIVADLRRARLAMWGIWLASFPLRFHAASRRDGVLSVKRGFTPEELTSLLAEAGVTARARPRAGWRVVASWVPTA